ILASLPALQSERGRGDPGDRRTGPRRRRARVGAPRDECRGGPRPPRARRGPRAGPSLGGPRGERQSSRRDVAAGLRRGGGTARQCARSAAQCARNPGALHRRSRRGRRRTPLAPLAYRHVRTAMKPVALLAIAIAALSARTRGSNESAAEAQGVTGVRTTLAAREPFTVTVN